MTRTHDFRASTREWLEQHCPHDMRRSARGEQDVCWGGRKFVFQSQAQKQWLEAMAGIGWTVPTWPRAYGGGGLDESQAAILRDEMQRIGARSPLNNFGISMLGPALLKYGSEEQKLSLLPQIARGEIRWCQGYSEPNAGSDLAAVAMRAVREGDEYVVTGQKIWTSYADQADWIFCLVRTNTEAPKHRGISFILIDMESVGISTRPIRLISGKSPFCETFFDQVRVPAANLVGELDHGWEIAKYVLVHERGMIGAGGTAKGALSDIGLADHAAALVGRTPHGTLSDPLLRADIARAEIDQLCLELTTRRYNEEARVGHDAGAASAVLKLLGPEVKKHRLELLMRCAGFQALTAEYENEDHGPGPLAHEWLRSKATSIEGGTSEIILNIIAKTVLGLREV